MPPIRPHINTPRRPLRQAADGSLSRPTEPDYGSIVDAISDGLLVCELSGRLVSCNPAACHMFAAEAGTLGADNVADLAADESRHLFRDFSHALQARREFRARGSLQGGDGTTFPADVRAVPFDYGGRPQALVVVRDISDEAAAYQQLEQRVEGRTRELSTLLAVSRNVTLTLELEPLLNQILDQLRMVVDYTSASVLELQDEVLQVLAYRAPQAMPEVLEIRYAPDPVIDAPVLIERQNMIIADVHGDTRLARVFQDRVGARMGDLYRDLHAWMRVPLVVRDRVIGALTLHHVEAGFFTERHARLAAAVADQAAVAIENARLYEAQQRRSEQFRVINEVGQRITSILAEDELLFQTVRVIHAALGWYHVAIGLIEADEVVYRAGAGELWDSADFSSGPRRVKIGQQGLSGRAAAQGDVLLVPDVSQDARYMCTQPNRSRTRSELVIPLVARGQTIGVLDVQSERLNAFDDQDVNVLQALADQAAVAIDNARLYQQARQLAALEERQKLARELHDSVSQALYGIALGARTARSMIEGQAPRSDLREPLDYVLSLAETGMAEMRALIFELRPESLASEGLVAALSKQADALRARFRLEVRAELGDEPPLSLEAKEALYRIAQEALHNIAKHAGATRVWLRLGAEGEVVWLQISDDGAGFDAGSEFPGHLGLKSMRERAQRAHGIFSLESAPGQGTRLSVRLPAAAAAG
jgi:PAS domain S-box-containing protein